ncbi:phosphatidylinositol 3,4,5-trisphosphate 3-phosphatase and protein-tyrosine-phosphatase PTEN2A-like [Actinidia eriantha]|uniref:phosphatidylinositol 3,4,5-trisphosphate 3-phosphatase and protein-tyrosine-phosphatase PTEN2A-like n=1 Tax=Actinidia eriantha TaxID=165200 RepID=UPI00258F14FC|nr:phosphatidylinositol 3,4,5-trisphosphate 3-phosphatase and protein-tyrosine-phosphatase PTEN2A-like [Actinidia eriantha]
MNKEAIDPLSPDPDKAAANEPSAPAVSGKDSSADGSPSMLSTSGLSSWAKSLKLPQSVTSVQEDSQIGNAGKSTFARLASGFGLHLPAKVSGQNEGAEGTSATAQSGVFESLTKGLVDSSRTAVKAVQVKARHIVSQNKRRYQEGGFDLDLTYITENIIAMGFPAGDMSSGFFGYVEGFYRNHMEEVIKFFETHHKGKYKVYNLCSERLYNAALFEGKVASLPFDDHNCPPVELITLFCQSAYMWLKEDIQNVVVVHCKAGMARTGLMISSLLLFLKFFPTAEECIEYYNQKRCVDGKGLILPSQIRYVKYFERILTYFNGENQPGRRCMLRGFRLHNCPYWIRPSITISDHNGILFSTRKHSKTKDLMPEDFWMRSPKKGIVVFALPGEPGLTELTGDFKIHFHDRQGDFYCWLNTTMMENRIILNNSELDGFDKRKLPSPGFQVEIVMIDYDGSIPAKKKAEHSSKESDGRKGNATSTSDEVASTTHQSKANENQDNDDVFSDSDGEETASSKSSQARAGSGAGPPTHLKSATGVEQMTGLTHGTQQLSVSRGPMQSNSANETKTDGVGRFDSGGMSSDIKAIAADASVFSFGDEEDYESD